MKVALITNFCTHYRYKLFKLLSEKYRFDIFLFGDPEKTKEDIRHLKIIRDEEFYFLPMKKILLKLIKNRYDIVIKCTNKKWAFLLSFLISKMIGSKFIVWHSIWYFPKTLQYKFFSWLFLIFLKKFTDAIVTYGWHGKKFLIGKGVCPEKIFIAWQSVDNELYGREVSDKEVEDLKSKLGIKKNNIILYVGRFEKLKGLEYLIEALEILKEKRTDFILLCVGGGRLKKEINEHLEKNKIKVIFTGIVHPEKLPLFYNLATLLVLPSITTKKFKESWGLVVNEAFNQGCPVVVTDAVGAGVGGLVKDGINGFVVPERNSKALAEAISKILTNNGLRNQMSKNCKEEIKKWTYERQAEGFLSAINYVLNAE